MVSKHPACYLKLQPWSTENTVQLAAPEGTMACIALYFHILLAISA